MVSKNPQSEAQYSRFVYIIFTPVNMHKICTLMITQEEVSLVFSCLPLKSTAGWLLKANRLTFVQKSESISDNAHYIRHDLLTKNA
jgi:hypothetical protein